MTRLERVRDKALIPAVFRDPKRIDKVLTLLVASGTKPDFDSGYWKKAKKQLKAESGGKCALLRGTDRHRRPRRRGALPAQGDLLVAGLLLR